jgi:sulfur-oxidizing protein SoxY
MPISRRTFVRASLVSTTLGAFAARSVNAALPAAVFDAPNPTAAIRAAMGSTEAVADERVRLNIPDRVENGDVVPVSVTADLGNVQRIALVADKNPLPVIAVFRFTPEVEGFVATRIRLAETCNVTALAESGGKLLTVSKPVQVMIGGCGSD